MLMLRLEYIRRERKREKVFERAKQSLNKLQQSIKNLQNTPTPDFNNIKEILKKLNKK